MALILDTGPIYASLDRRDQDHARCRRLIEKSDEPLLIPAAVLPEVDYLVSQRMGIGPMLALLRDISAGAYRVEHVNFEDYQRIAELMDVYADSDIGFVDASLVALAERLREPKVGTLDHRHFGMIRPVHAEALVLLPE